MTITVENQLVLCCLPNRINRLCILLFDIDWQIEHELVRVVHHLVALRVDSDKNCSSLKRYTFAKCIAVDRVLKDSTNDIVSKCITWYTWYSDILDISTLACCFHNCSVSIGCLACVLYCWVDCYYYYCFHCCHCCHCFHWDHPKNMIQAILLYIHLVIV